MRLDNLSIKPELDHASGNPQALWQVLVDRLEITADARPFSAGEAQITLDECRVCYQCGMPNVSVRRTMSQVVWFGALEKIRSPIPGQEPVMQQAISAQDDAVRFVPAPAAARELRIGLETPGVPECIWQWSLEPELQMRFDAIPRFPLWLAGDRLNNRFLDYFSGTFSLSRPFIERPPPGKLLSVARALWQAFNACRFCAGAGRRGFALCPKW